MYTDASIPIGTIIASAVASGLITNAIYRQAQLKA